MNSYYDILGVPYGATKDEIKRAFHKLAHIHHPDKGGDGEKFKQISNAYAQLSKSAPEKRYEDPAPKEDRYAYKTSYGFKRSTSWTINDFDNLFRQYKKQMDDLERQQKETEEALRKQFHRPWGNDYMM